MFFKTIVIREKEHKLENISHIWMGSNLSHKDLKKVLGENGGAKQIQQPTVEEVNQDWSRLKTFMSGVK